MCRLSVLSASCTSWLSFSSFPYSVEMQLILMHFISNNVLLHLWLACGSCWWTGKSIDVGSLLKLFSLFSDFLLIWWDSLLEHPMKRTLIALFSAAGWSMAKCTQRSYPFFVRTAARGSSGSAYHSWQITAPRFKLQRQNPGSPKERKLS